MLDAFRRRGVEADGPTIDLSEIALRQLEEAGVGEVEIAGICTSCDQRFFSTGGTPEKRAAGGHRMVGGELRCPA